MESKTEKTMNQQQKMLELKKHVAVIHSSNKLTLLQRKIANALLFNAYKELQEKEEHTIHIGKLCEIIGYDSNDHKSIKRALVNLISTVLEWNLVDEDSMNRDEVWNASSIIAGASINGAICTYSYSSQMRRLLYRPHMYGRLDMLVQSRFQSSYGLALYENCNRFQDIGQTPWFNLAKFRKLMGVEEGKYKIFRDFKTRVLDKAVEEVNQYSSLTIRTQLRKENRKVTSIQFLIQKSNEMSQTESKEVKLTDILQKEFGFSSRQAKETIGQYEEKYILEKIELIRSSLSFKNSRIKNVTRYLISALKNNYQQSNKDEQVKNTVLESKPESQNMDIITQTRFRRFQETELFKLFEALPEQEKAGLIRHFEKFLVGMYHQLYLRDGLSNILIQEQLSVFLKQIKHELVTRLVTYDIWIKQPVFSV
jgi:plasmid replication initiation protein